MLDRRASHQGPIPHPDAKLSMQRASYTALLLALRGIGEPSSKGNLVSASLPRGIGERADLISRSQRRCRLNFNSTLARASRLKATINKEMTI
jgi:hypothetical protein